MSLLPAEGLGRKLNHMDSLCRELFTKHNSLCRKRKLADSFIPCVTGPVYLMTSAASHEKAPPAIASFIVFFQMH